MTKNNEQTTIFLESINQDAKNRCNKMKQEIDSYISGELQKARTLAHEEVKSFKKNEFDRLNEQNNANLSILEAEETRKLIERRTQITNEVFEKATEKIIEFVNSDMYLAFLKSSIEKIQKELGDDATIILRTEDKKFEDELKPLCADIKYDKSITIGGCKAENIDAGMIADDTLEVRLNDAKQNFYKESNLSITL